MARATWTLVMCLGIGACSGKSREAGNSVPAVMPPPGSSGGGPAAVPDPHGSGNGAPDGGAPDAGVTALAPPLTKDGWTFYGMAQGLGEDVRDASADEGGNVYVAAGDAVYAKRKEDPAFLRFDAKLAGLTENCYALPDRDAPSALDAIAHPRPPGPAILCPVISVAGGTAGFAAVGLQGHGTDGDGDADWATDSGGADLVTFDGARLARTRHVFIASPPHVICAEQATGGGCNPFDFFWVNGRRKVRQVHRIVVNHGYGAALEHGDVWLAGTHGTFSVLLANAASRGWVDTTAGAPPKFADAQDVWEHAHPSVVWGPPGAPAQFWTNTAYGFAIDPTTGDPWGSNQLRTASLRGYGASASNAWTVDQWPPRDAAFSLASYLSVWTTDPSLGKNDTVMSLSFCDDGTLWIGSALHGLARRDPATGALSFLDLPDPAAHGNNAYAVACDPLDGSLWIGLGWGGVMRYKDGLFQQLDPAGLPAFVHQPVLSIQIDRWTSPRTLYFAFIPSKDASGAIVAGGGVATYDGP
jgi:hypothetical protein